MLIRPKTALDRDPCVALMRSTYALDGYPQYWPDRPDRFLTSRGESEAWVAEQDGEIVGHVALHDAAGHPTLPAAQRATGLPPSRLAVLARLLVAPHRRGTGVGRCLLSKATEHAYATGRRPVLDVVQASTDPIRMYERAGWTRLEPVTLEIGDWPPLHLWVYLAPAVPSPAAG